MKQSEIGKGFSPQHLQDAPEGRKVEAVGAGESTAT